MTVLEQKIRLSNHLSDDEKKWILDRYERIKSKKSKGLIYIPENYLIKLYKVKADLIPFKVLITESIVISQDNTTEYTDIKEWLALREMAIKAITKDIRDKKIRDNRISNVIFGIVVAGIVLLLSIIYLFFYGFN